MDEGRAVWNSRAGMGNPEQRAGPRVRRSRVRPKFQAQLDPGGPGWGDRLRNLHSNLKSAGESLGWFPKKW